MLGGNGKGNNTNNAEQINKPNKSKKYQQQEQNRRDYSEEDNDSESQSEDEEEAGGKNLKQGKQGNNFKSSQVNFKKGEKELRNGSAIEVEAPLKKKSKNQVIQYFLFD